MLSTHYQIELASAAEEVFSSHFIKWGHIGDLGNVHDILVFVCQTSPWTIFIDNFSMVMPSVDKNDNNSIKTFSCI